LYAFSPALRAAAEDYRFLLDKGYPEKPSLRLVGDRYRLDRDERMALFRGVAASAKSDERRKKLVGFPAVDELHLDGYNVLFTILNYREGKKVFVSSDGFLRDAGGSHGRIGDERLFLDLTGDLVGFLASRGLRGLWFYLDSPVSHSAEHAVGVREAMAAYGLAGGCELYESADFGLKSASPPCAATSDSAIIDALDCPIYDAARDFLSARYRPDFPEFLPGAPRT